MTLEYLIIEFCIEKPTALNKQIKFHHSVIVSVYVLSLYCGYGSPGCASAVLLGEFSSIFLSYKSMFSEESRNSRLAKVNLLCFFLAFTIFRIIFFPFLVYQSAIQIILSHKFVSYFKACCMVYCITFGSLVALLNFYWYTLILRGLQRMLEQSGVIKKSTQN